MKSDPLFFHLFKNLPSSFFRLVGRREADAKRYKFLSIEYKATAVRLDGVFLPDDPEAGPAYIWEAQLYSSDKFYANFLTKINRFLEHGDPNQDFVAVAIYKNRGTEQKNLKPYRYFTQSDQLIRIYLDELPPAGPDQFVMGILAMIAAKQADALEQAKAMVPRVKSSKLPKKFVRKLLELIETVIVHQFPDLSREEIEKMIEVTDFRQTRVFKDAFVEGKEKGLEKGRDEGREAVALNMLDKKHPIAEIAELTGLTTAQVRKLVKKPK